MLRRALLNSLTCLSVVALLAASGAAAEPPPAAPRLTLDGLLNKLATMPGLEARFVERKHMKLLAKPLVSKGALYYTRPGYLARHVTAPKPVKMLITPRHLEISQGAGRQQIDLSARPDVKTFVESFARLLAGDKRALAGVYALKFTTTAEPTGRWTLQLTPKAATLRKLVSKLTVKGKSFAVASIRVDETSGDYAVTEISGADPGRRFTAAERKTLFGF